jgi:hypothetical protein
VPERPRPPYRWSRLGIEGHGWAKKDRIAGATISGLPRRLVGPTSVEPPWSRPTTAISRLGNNDRPSAGQDPARGRADGHGWLLSVSTGPGARTAASRPTRHRAFTRRWCCGMVASGHLAFRLAGISTRLPGVGTRVDGPRRHARLLQLGSAQTASVTDAVGQEDLVPAVDAEDFDEQAPACASRGPLYSQPGLRARITSVSPGQSQKMPSGERDVSSSRTSLAKSSTRSPNRCGAEEEREK